MSECWECHIPEHWQTCVGCRPEGCNLNDGDDEYPPLPEIDPHKRCHGLHEAIKKVLKNKIYLNPKDVKRIVFTYFGESEWRKGKENCYAGIMIEISKNAFFMGTFERGDMPKSLTYYLGYFWIGRTRYEIWRA